MDRRRAQTQKGGPPLARVLAALGVAITLPLWPRVAPAQSESAWERDVLAPARAGCSAPLVVSLCKEAHAHTKQGEFEAARVLYARALDVNPSAGVLFNLALAELLSSGHAVDALHHFRFYLEAQFADPAKLAIVRTELLPKAFAATGHLNVRGAPSGAEFYVDDQEVYPDDGAVDVAPGRHTLVASTATVAFEAQVDASAGKVTAVTFLRQVPPRVHPPHAPGPYDSFFATQRF
jgi:tetratricopeptide (TPR) repeat protein